MEESKKRLKDLFLSDKEKQKETIDRIKEGHNVHTRLDFLWYENAKAALHSLVNENNIFHTKDYFYICGLLDECMINKFDSRILSYGMSHICYVFLSDNKPLMKRYAHLSHTHYQTLVERGNSTAMYVLQQIILENWERVAWGIHIMDTKNKTLNKVMKPDRDFYEGLMNRNEVQVTQAIQQLLKDHKKRNKYLGLAADFISIPALGYAKLAWLKGMEIDIDHPLIPKELLPYRPLEKYTDSYDFLKEL